MKCPHCHVVLASADRQGIEIDFCPQCWGIWLDRGELNLLIEREADTLKAIMSGAHGLGPPTPDAAPLPGHTP